MYIIEFTCEEHCEGSSEELSHEDMLQVVDAYNVGALHPDVDIKIFHKETNVEVPLTQALYEEASKFTHDKYVSH